MNKIKFQKKNARHQVLKLLNSVFLPLLPPPPPPSLPKQLNFLDMPKYILDRINKSSDFPTSMVYKCKSIQNYAV